MRKCEFSHFAKTNISQAVKSVPLREFFDNYSFFPVKISEHCKEILKCFHLPEECHRARSLDLTARRIAGQACRAFCSEALKSETVSQK